MTRRYIVSLLYLLIFSQVVGKSNDPLIDSLRTYRWYVPHTLHLQFAGNLGLLSLGPGYNFSNDKYRVAFLYGYVPKIIANRSIHLVSVKNSFRIFQLKTGKSRLSSYAGFAPTLELGGNSFVKLPSRYPSNYYKPNAIRFSLFAGATWRPDWYKAKGLIKRTEFFAEVVTADMLVWYKFQRTISYSQIFSVAFGVTFYLKR